MVKQSGTGVLKSGSLGAVSFRKKIKKGESEREREEKKIPDPIPVFD